MSDDMSAQLASAIGTAMATQGDMVTRWVACVEVIEQDGSRAMWILTDPEATTWDTLGLIEYARVQEKATALSQEE